MASWVKVEFEEVSMPNAPMLVYAIYGIANESITDSSYAVKVLWVSSIGFEVFTKVENEIINGSGARINVNSPN
jgi:hypothetical protein